jgi:UDP-glucose 4-epimerase
MKEKVMITGASGFLGFHLIEAALLHNMEVYAAVRKNSNIKHLEHLPVSFIYPDFTDIDSLQREINSKQYNYIIHAAGVTKAKNEGEYNIVNADFTFNLAKASERADIPLKKFVFISSLAALGPLNNFDDTINEITVPMPVTSYGRSKLSAEGKIRELSIPLIILRPTAVYGPRDKDIFIMFKTIKKGMEPYIGKRKQQLSFVYAKDVATAAVNSLLSNCSGSYNLSDGHSYSRYEFADYLKIFMKKKTIKIYLPRRLVNGIAITLENVYKVLNKIPALNKEKINELAAANWVCNIDKAKRELGFNPLYNLEEGLKESVDWYKQYKWL